MDHSGAGAAEKNDFKFYDDMDNLLGHRPGYMMNGVDSSMTSEESQGQLKLLPKLYGLHIFIKYYLYFLYFYKL